jgi:hypothetical protein
MIQLLNKNNRTIWRKVIKESDILPCALHRTDQRNRKGPQLQNKCFDTEFIFLQLF